jgi:peptidoglycan hydrolase CwlO-like protein
MTQLLIILAMSKTGAVVFIIALLLVAAIIGYLTAWFYAKSVYTPIIKQLEAEKADLQKQVAGLKDEVAGLNGKIKDLNARIDDLNGKIGNLEEQVASKEKEIRDLKGKIRE